MNCYIFALDYKREVIIIREDTLDDAWKSLKDTHYNVYDQISFKGEVKSHQYATIKG